MFLNVVAACLSLGLCGLALGALLAGASRLFAVKSDTRIDEITAILPGANCGGCGYSGCQAYAAAVVKKGAKSNLCPVGGDEAAAKIAAVMGVEPEQTTRLCAYVKCSGCDSFTTKKYIYNGLRDCAAAMLVGGGDKDCAFACVGFGNCVRQCKFGAISLVDGVAFVDKVKCAACGMCAAACPKHLIELIPYENKFGVSCSSQNRGSLTREVCEVGCIGCRLCEKVCEYGAIRVSDNLAAIDFSRCQNCGACAEKCPRGIIQNLRSRTPAIQKKLSRPGGTTKQPANIP